MEGEGRGSVDTRAWPSAAPGGGLRAAAPPARSSGSTRWPPSITRCDRTWPGGAAAGLAHLHDRQASQQEEHNVEPEGRRVPPGLTEQPAAVEDVEQRAAQEPRNHARACGCDVRRAPEATPLLD